MAPHLSLVYMCVNHTVCDAGTLAAHLPYCGAKSSMHATWQVTVLATTSAKPAPLAAKPSAAGSLPESLHPPAL